MTSPGSEPIVVVDRLTRTYRSGDREIKALDGVSFQVDSGEYVAVRGASGSGKTTLLNLLAGLDAATSGTVRVAGATLADLSEGQLARLRSSSIGLVFQDACLVAGLSAIDNVRLPTMLARTAAADSRSAEELLESVGLSDRRRHFPHQLSRGEMQRVALARALVMSPEILLVDEPTASLDEESSRDVRSRLDECRERYGAAVILATHDRSLALDADRTMTLEYGRLAGEPGAEPVGDFDS